MHCGLQERAPRRRGKYWGFDLTHWNQLPPRTRHRTGHLQERPTLPCHTLQTLLCLFHGLAMPERMTRDRTLGYTAFI